MKVISRALLVYFEGVMETDELRAHFNLDKLHVNTFLQWVLTSNNISANLIANVMRTKASARTMPLNLIMFSNSHDCVFQEMGTKQVRQVLQASLALATLPRKTVVYVNSVTTCFAPSVIR